MNFLNIKSYAKLNLYIKVLNKRNDNYHNILTLFERISLFDRISLKLQSGRDIKIICRRANLPKDERNLAYQAAFLLQKKLGIDKGVVIKIEKHIPVASGLGGGSSNAATVLLGLNRVWNLGLSLKRLVNFGKKLGADVPFFLHKTSFALGTERGDRIKIIPIKNKFWYVLIVPRIKVATKSIYQRLDEMASRGTVRLTHSAALSVDLGRKVERLTNPKDDVKILLHGLKKNNPLIINEATFNHLELVSLDLYPKLSKIKEKLLYMGLRDIAMSGSGPAMFVFVSSRKEGKGLCRQLGKNSHWQTFLVRTC